MARSAKQYENQIKVIIVAALARGFKKAAIVDRIVSKAKSLNQVATKGLIFPELTGSVIPSRNDRWLIKKDAVIVKVGAMNYGVPQFVKIQINLEYGLSEEYYWLTEESPKASWHPDGNQIANWIKAKGNRGNFEYRGKSLDVNKDYQVRSVAYVISRSISRKGIRKTSLFNPFKDSNNGVEAVVNKALPSVYERINLLYGAELESALIQMFEVFR